MDVLPHLDICRGLHIGTLLTRAGSKPLDVRARRQELGVTPSMKRVDTCAAEFQADTPYMYSSYDGSDECEPTNQKKVRPWRRGLRTSPYLLPTDRITLAILISIYFYSNSRPML